MTSSGWDACIIRLADGPPRMKPDSSLVRSISDGLSVQALAEDGTAYAIYLHAPLPKDPKTEHPRDRIRASVVVRLPAGLYLAEWIDTTTGIVAEKVQFEHLGGEKLLRSPAFTSDLALRILRTPKRARTESKGM